MDNRRVLSAGGAVRSLLAVLTAASLLWLMGTLPVLAAGPLRLSESSVSPERGAAGAIFTFGVRYTSKDAVRPLWVRLTVDGTARLMAPVDATATDYRAGIRFRLAVPLAAGVHRFSFSASDGKARVATLAGGTVRASAATTTPESEPTPTPVPSGGGRPVTTPAPGGGAAPGGAAPGGAAPGGAAPDGAPEPAAPDRPAPTDRPAPAGPDSQAAPSPAPESEPAAAGPPDRASTGLSGPLDDPTHPDDTDSGGPGTLPTGAVPGGGDTAAAGPVGANSGPDEDKPAPDGREGTSVGGAAMLGGERLQGAGGSLAAMSTGLPGFGSDRWIQLALQGAAISTTASVGVAMALLAFRRRRQDDEDGPDAIPPTDPGAALVAPALAQLVTTPAEADSEAHMPRWRRPSLMAARKAAPGTDLAVLAAERLTFEHGSVAPDVSRERRRIKYRLVRLSDGPDEFISAEIGRLDQGDEVELLERTGSYWRVRTPNGHEGWVHRMTLGEALGYEPSPEPVGGPRGLDLGAGAADPPADEDGSVDEMPAVESLAARFIGQRATD